MVLPIAKELKKIATCLFITDLFFTVARTCSLIFIVLDVLKPLQHKKILQRELEGFGIRLNKEPPNIGYRRKEKGGVNLTCTVSIKQWANFELLEWDISSQLSNSSLHDGTIVITCWTRRGQLHRFNHLIINPLYSKIVLGQSN